MGRWQPNCASFYCLGTASWPRTHLLMAALTMSFRLLVNDAMALSLFLIPVVLSQAFSAIKAAAPGDSLSLSVILSLLVCLCWASSAFTISVFHSAPAPGAHSFVRAQSPLLSGYSALSRLPLCTRPSVTSLCITMLRERLKMGSRRGGSRGRATHQHSSTTSYPSSNALDFCCLNYSATKSGMGKGRGQARIGVCEHHAHPTTRFCIPCSLENSSFIVSMTIEKCENAKGSGATQLGVPVDQRLASPKVTQRKLTGGLSAVNSKANVGPSAPARGEPSGSVVHPSDSNDSDQFGCRIVEEQPSTSDED